MSGSIGTISLITKVGDVERKYFINNPDITFFKSVYRKHTNFSKYLKTDILADNSEELTYTKNIQTGSEDLLAKIYLENKLIITQKTPDTDLEIFANLGSNLIENNDDEALSITIGTNKSAFKSYGLFQEVKGELLNQMSLTFDNASGTHAPELQVDNGIISCKSGSHYNYTTLSGGVRGITIPSGSFTTDDNSNASIVETEYFYTIPEFSFMKDYGLALPLLCMRNDGNITFKVKFKPKGKLIRSSTGNSSDFQLKYNSNIIQELIQLDTDEKSRFLTSQLSYLTESITRIDISSKSPDIKSSIKLCKYILLVGKPEETTGKFSASLSLSTPSELIIKDLNITIGGNPLYPNITRLNKEIFTKMNINKYFPGCGRDLNAGTDSPKNYGQLDTIAMLPFSIEPLNYTQPSGCISNQGQIGSIKLDLETNPVSIFNPNIVLYAINYNILQIADGRSQIQYP
jgi:hypothetical protein